MATAPTTPLAFVPAPELVVRLRAAADDITFAGRKDLHGDADLMREAADRIERAEASRRRVLLGGGL